MNILIRVVVSIIIYTCSCIIQQWVDHLRWISDESRIDRLRGREGQSSNEHDGSENIKDKGINSVLL